MKSPGRFAWAVLGLALGGCAGSPRVAGVPGPTGPARADVVARTVPLKLALAPLAGIPLANASRLWKMIADAAEQRGFQIVDDVKTAAELLQLGRFTGNLPHEDPAAVRARAALHAVLASRTGVDGVLYVGFAQRRARVRDGVAMWDGVTEPILALAGDPHDTARGYRGEVEAWSLRLWIENAHGAPIAEGYGGISIEARLHAGRWASAEAGPRLREPRVLPAAIRAAVADLGRAP